MFRITKVAQYSSVRPHRFCGTRSPARFFLHGAPARASTLRYVRVPSPFSSSVCSPFSNLANLPARARARVFSSLGYLALSLLPTVDERDSNKSTGFYSCLSDILYSAREGPGASPPVPPPLRHRLHVRARGSPYVISEARCAMRARYKKQRMPAEDDASPCSGPYLLDSLHAARVFFFIFFLLLSVRDRAPARGDISAPSVVKPESLDSLPRAIDNASLASTD